MKIYPNYVKDYNAVLTEAEVAKMKSLTTDLTLGETVANLVKYRE